MTLPETGSTRHPPTSLYARDVVALVCILASLAGLMALAWTVDWRLAAAIPCLVLLGAGVVVGIDR